MAVEMTGNLETVPGKINLQNSYKLSSECLCLGLRGYSQILLYSFLFSYSSFSFAGPAGGNIVGGRGHIHVSGLSTDIHQNTSALAINWDSYNLSANEVVNYLQPSSSSIALNRITGNGGSQILGQINANGQVVLVNPNGIFFGATASVNVGGLIASGLDIKPIDFMNGDYVFSSIDGSSGAVINGGILNASLGGSISLIGKQVKNEGLISANLGAVNLAAGKEAVLTFDNEGLMGVKISKAALQDELGVDPAILNSGEIAAAGGRVLLTASQSQDIFSQAVNSNGIKQATSVVVNADGSFTLGGGANVLNSGTVSTSSNSGNAGSGNAGQIVILGENISSSGTIAADSAGANGGGIELHARDTTRLTENSLTSAQSAKNGRGGEIKVLGDKVGLFDQSVVDASGASGGGEVLIGGDIQGQNNQIRNADFLYLGENTTVKANALDSGKGGKIISFARDTSRIFGSLQARGGLNAGDGGFIETSGLKSFQITATPDISSPTGLGGEWLIDPNNIRIVGGNGSTNISNSSPFLTGNDGAVLGVDLIIAALSVNNNASVTITTGTAGADTELGNITFETNLDYDGTGTGNTLTLNAVNDIIFNASTPGNTIGITDGNVGTADSLNINLYAGRDIVLNADVTINTQGGNFIVGGIVDGTPDNFTSTGATIDTSGIDYISLSGNPPVLPTDAGDINITASVAVNISALIATGGTPEPNSTIAIDRQGKNGGDITLNASSVMVNEAIDVSGSAGSYNTLVSNTGGGSGGIGGGVEVRATSGNINVAKITTSGGEGAGVNNRTAGDGGDAGTIALEVTEGNTITLNGDLLSIGAIGFINATGLGRYGNGANITLAGDVILAENIIVDTQGFVGPTGAPGTDGAILFENSISADTRAGARTLQLISGLNNTTVVGGIGVDNALQSFTITRSNNAELNAITTQSGGVSITANNIVLNGDINTGASTAQLSLMSDSTGSGSVTINYVDGFTSLVTITGGAGTDTINAANRENIWNINAANAGNLNTQIVFTGIETLQGAEQGDAFNFTGSGAITNILGGDGINTLKGRDINSDWQLTAANAGSVSDVRDGANPVLYITAFSGIEALTGGGASDSFTLNGGTLSGTIEGGAGNDTLTGDALANTWQVSALNEGTVNGVDNSDSNLDYDFTGIENLTGNTGTDNFVLNGGTLSGTIDGGTGEDSLSAGDVANTWVINGANQGNVTGVDEAGVNGGYDFIEIENITGGILDDAFTFRDGASISGVVNGGAENRGGGVNLVAQGDTLDMSAVSGAIELVIGATPLSAAGMNIVSIERITGNNDGSDVNNTNTSQLTGEQADVANGNITNNWVLFDSAGAGGLVNDGTVSNENGTTTFINFTALQGSDRDDVFDRSSPGTLAMSIDGGSEQNADQLDFSNQSGEVRVNLNAGLNTTIAGIEGVIGNDFNSTLIAKDGQLNVWQIDGNNDGILNVNDADSMTFINFNILQGGDGIDNFTVINNGSIGNQNAPQTDTLSGIKGGAGMDMLITNSSDSTPGHILFEGGAGDDRVRLTLTGDQNGSFTFNGEEGNDTLDILGEITENSNYTEVYTADVGGNDQLVYTNTSADNTINVYSIAFTNINNGAVNDNVSAQSLGINGSANVADTIVLNIRDFQVNTNTQVNYINKASLLVDGLGGADTININSTLNFVGGRVELTAQSISNLANNTFAIAADDLVLDTSISIGNDTAAIGDSTNALRTNVINLALVGVDGSVFIAEQSALNITALSNNNGTLNIVANGDVSSAVDLRSAANIDIAAGVGDIVFASTNNRLTGRLSLSGDAVTLNNTVLTRLNNITATTLNVSTTQGRILDVDTGAVQVAGLSTLNAPVIILDGPNLNLAGLEVNNSTDVRINNGANALNVRGINSTGLVNISSGTLEATGDIAGSDITLNTQGASVTLNTLNAANAITINTTDLTQGAGNAGSGNISFNGVTANTGGVTVSGNDITQGGDLVSEGDVVFNATGIFDMQFGFSANVNNGGFSVDSEGMLNVQTLTAANDIVLNSNTRTVNILNDTSSAQGSIDATAGRNVQLNGATSALLDINITTRIDGGVLQNNTLSSAQGDITVESVQGINMGGVASSTATTGNIQYNAQGSVSAASLSAPTGKVGINSSAGGVTDTNAGTMNFIADILEIRAVTGVGSGDQLETQVGLMDVVNTGSGLIDFQQTGNVELRALQNTGSFGGIDFRTDADINLNQNSVFAARTQGQVNRGRLLMTTMTGSILGLGVADLNNPDISARDAIIRVENGNFGSLNRPITMDIDNSVLIDADVLFNTRFVPPGPAFFDITGIDSNVIAAALQVSVDTLLKIDPGFFTDLQSEIFTDLHNYSAEEIAIKMPRSQWFEDELELIRETEF